MVGLGFGSGAVEAWRLGFPSSCRVCIAYDAHEIRGLLVGLSSIAIRVDDCFYKELSRSTAAFVIQAFMFCQTSGCSQKEKKGTVVGVMYPLFNLDGQPCAAAMQILEQEFPGLNWHAKAYALEKRPLSLDVKSSTYTQVK
ncbi:Uncharacterized protein TCM_034850 [Theobroma cacao]|uniref:Uncharacterized protein n=1 Tax=Theobroma cacao TaxID=3641 RepID=A0A061FG84_THECC|nr:Uncharacterized protein TCM_034850 [Theobroma cacao]